MSQKIKAKTTVLFNNTITHNLFLREEPSISKCVASHMILTALFLRLKLTHHCANSHLAKVLFSHTIAIKRGIVGFLNKEQNFSKTKNTEQGGY